MRELAEFEKYANDFAVTEEVLREQGFRRSPPDFYCLIAESGGELVGSSFIILCPSLIEQSRICWSKSCMLPTDAVARALASS